MNICHVVSSISRIGAGVSKVVRDLSYLQSAQRHNVKIITLEDEFTSQDQHSLGNISTFAAPVELLPRFGYSRLLRDTLIAYKESIDIIHMHGLWMYPNWAAGAMARKHNIPFIMSPHGMLDSRSLNMKKWKKRLARFLFEGANIWRAACLHACSDLEAAHIRSFGYKGPIVVVSSGLSASELTIATSEYTSSNKFNKTLPQLINKKIILYLSRLHEQKGLHFLIDAWRALQQRYPDWHLVIAGDGENDFVAMLNEDVQQKGLMESVTFLGPVYGDEKWQLLKSASLFVLPTYSENFGLVITEALASGVPVITTHGTSWKNLETYNCGWWIKVGREPLEGALSKALALSENELAAMGLNGRRLVETKYTMERASERMSEVYEWVLSRSERPLHILE